jgi:hypothetical protein
MKKGTIIGLCCVAALVAIIFIPKHLKSMETGSSVAAEATESAPLESSSNITRAAAVDSKAESAPASSTPASSEAEATVSTTTVKASESSGSDTTATTTSLPKKIVLKKSVPTEAVEKLFNEYIPEPSLKWQGEDAITTTTEKAADTTQTTISDPKSDQDDQTTTATDPNDVYKDIVIKKVMVKPEQEFNGSIIRDEVPEWQIIIEYREEKDGVLWPKLLAATTDYFDPMNPNYETQKWYFATNPFVNVGEDYYKPVSFINAVLSEFKIDIETLDPYVPFVLMSYIPESQIQEAKEEPAEDDNVIVDENGNKFIIVEEE